MSGLRSGKGGFGQVQGGRAGTPGQKLDHTVERDCQCCGKRFRTTRDVPYCYPCYREKHPRRF